MAFSEETANRIRQAVTLFPETFKEKKMFGGLSFLYEGKMTVGIVKEDLAVRVLADKVEAELQKEFTRPMDFTKRPMKEFVFVSPKGFNTEAALQYWVELGLEHAKSKL